MPYDKHGKVVGTAAQRKAYDLRHRRKLGKKPPPQSTYDPRQAAKTRPDTSPGGPIPQKRTSPGNITDVLNRFKPGTQKRDFQPYAAGKPVYGGGRSAPNVGPVSGKEGYAERDLTKRAYADRAQRLYAAKRKRNG